jgi:hypothetical protein
VKGIYSRVIYSLENLVLISNLKVRLKEHLAAKINQERRMAPQVTPSLHVRVQSKSAQGLF